MFIEEKLDLIIKMLKSKDNDIPAHVQAELEAAKAANAKPAKAEKPAKDEKPTKGKGKAKAPEHTLEDVKALAVAISKDKAIDEGKEKVVALLARFGVETLKELNDSVYDEFYSQLEQVRDDGFDPRESDVEGEDAEPEDDPF